MFGREELDSLNVQKQALLLESSLNRLALQAELQRWRSASGWVSAATHAPRKLTPLLLPLVPLAGFLLARGFRRSGSRLSWLLAAVKWVAPLYQLWRTLAPVRKEVAAGKPAA
mgnify:CR=1 FL=1